MKKYLSIMIAAVTMLAGCSIEEPQGNVTPIVPVEVGEHSFIASFAMNEQTKTSIAPVNINNNKQYGIFWKLNDEIEIKKGTEETSYTFKVKELVNNGAQAVFEPVDEVGDGFFSEDADYSATYGTEGNGTYTQTSSDDIRHLYMTATGKGNALVFTVSKSLFKVTIPSGVNAKGIIVKNGENQVSKVTTTADNLTDFYVPVAATADAKYNIYLYSDADCTNEIAESMKMYSTQNIAANTVYPFTFTPTLKITGTGTYSLKSYPGDYKVWFTNDAQTGKADDIDNLTIQYTNGAESHPAKVYIDGKGSTVSNLSITTPDSHVVITNGESATVTSQTSKSTCVVTQTYTISQSLTVEKGSVTVEGKTNGEKNVEKIVLDYGSSQETMTGVVISVANVTSGTPVTIENKTTNTQATPITVVGTKTEESSQDGGFTIKDGKEQNITIAEKASAKIGDTVYTTLADAVAAVTDGTPTTIVMIADEEMTSANGPTIGNGKNITIDLAGHTINANLQNTDRCAVINIANNGNLTMKDSGNDGKIILNSAIVGSWPTPNVATNVFTNQGNLTIEGGYYENKGQGECAYVVDNNSNTGNVSLTVNGGHLFAQYCPIRTFLNSASTTNIVNITNGVFEGIFVAYFQQPDEDLSSPLTCTISGGTFIGKTTYRAAVHMFYFGVQNASALNFVISGGQFSTSNSEKYFVYPDVTYQNHNCNIKVSGGTYSNSNIVSSPAKIEDGFIVSGPSAGYYTVKPSEGNVAKVVNGSTETSYKTLAEAFAAVQANGTIELLADVDLNNEEWTPVVFSNKTFDGKGHTVKNLKVDVTGNGKVSGTGFIGNGDCSTIKNLTIDGASVTGINQVGIIAGRGMCTKIENCHVKNATVTSNVLNNDDGDKVAAICGYLSGEWQAWVRNCSVENCTVTGYRDLGSIVGYAECYTSTSQNTGIADVSGNRAKDVQVICKTDKNYKGYTTNAQCHAGQILGEQTVNATVSNNTVDNVTVTYTPGLAYNVANVGGTNYTDLHEALEAAKNGLTCELLADVDLTGVNWTPITGFYGTLDGKNHIISNLTVDGTACLGLIGSAPEGGGGIVKDLTITGANISGTGNNVAVVFGSSFRVNMSNVTVTNSTVSSSNGEYIGALAGGAYTTLTGCTVSNCSITGLDQVGGAIGYFCGASITGCTLTNNTVKATHTTGGRAGAIIGKANLDDSADDVVVNNNTVNGGSVDATFNVGGVAGQMMGSDAHYAVKNNQINDVELKTTDNKSPIANLRSGQKYAFTIAISTNITGNTWTSKTYAGDSYTYPASTTDGAGDQVIHNTAK